MEVLLARTRLAGGNKLIGYYYPTAKNGMVRDFYGLHGFSLLEDVAGATVWVYDLAAKDTSPAQRHFIMVKEAEVD